MNIDKLSCYVPLLKSATKKGPEKSRFHIFSMNTTLWKLTCRVRAYIINGGGQKTPALALLVNNRCIKQDLFKTVPSVVGLVHCSTPWNILSKNHRDKVYSSRSIFTFDLIRIHIWFDVAGKKIFLATCNSLFFFLLVKKWSV